MSAHWLAALRTEIAHAIKGINGRWVFSLLPMRSKMALLRMVGCLVLPGYGHKAECFKGKKQCPEKGYCHHGKEH